MTRRQLHIQTLGRSTTEITQDIAKVVHDSKVREGLCHLFIHHTSASLMITENADPDVRRDLERFFSDLVVDGDPRMMHTAEGPDDMSSHIRSVLTQSSLTIPVVSGRCDLGTWQGIFIWEHREHPHQRRITVSVTGT